MESTSSETTVPTPPAELHDREPGWYPEAFRALRARTSAVAFMLRSLFQHSTTVGGIDVRGPKPFCDSVAAALQALAAGAPAAFDLCQRHVKLVVKSRHSGVNATARRAIVMLGEWATSVSTAYLASSLAHEAMHCTLYWSYRDSERARRVPREVFSGESAERECIEYQITVLKELGETGGVVDHLRGSMKTGWWNVRWHERTW